MTNEGKESEKNVMELLSDIQREFGAVTLQGLVKDPRVLSVLTRAKSTLHAVIWYTQPSPLLPDKARPVDLITIDAEAVLLAAKNYLNGASAA
jgi:hypothetical protein